MIPTGLYRIHNVLHKDRYAHMKSDDRVVGAAKGDNFEVVVTNAVLGLATIFNGLRKKFVVIDGDTGDVVGSTKSQELQLSTEGGGEYIIHEMNVNQVWILDGGSESTPITTAPAPPEGVEGYKMKYWKFVRLDRADLEE